MKSHLCEYSKVIIQGHDHNVCKKKVEQRVSTSLCAISFHDGTLRQAKKKFITEIRENSAIHKMFLVQLNSVTNTLSADICEGVRPHLVKLPPLKATTHMRFKQGRLKHACPQNLKNHNALLSKYWLAFSSCSSKCFKFLNPSATWQEVAITYNTQRE